MIDERVIQPPTKSVETEVEVVSFDWRVLVGEALPEQRRRLRKHMADRLGAAELERICGRSPRWISGTAECELAGEAVLGTPQALEGAFPWLPEDNRESLVAQLRSHETIPIVAVTLEIGELFYRALDARLIATDGFDVAATRATWPSADEPDYLDKASAGVFRRLKAMEGLLRQAEREGDWSCARHLREAIDGIRYEYRDLCDYASGLPPSNATAVARSLGLEPWPAGRSRRPPFSTFGPAKDSQERLLSVLTGKGVGRVDSDRLIDQLFIDYFAGSGWYFDEPGDNRILNRGAQRKKRNKAGPSTKYGQVQRTEDRLGSGEHGSPIFQAASRSQTRQVHRSCGSDTKTPAQVRRR